MGLERFEAGDMDEGRKVLEIENGLILILSFSRAGSNRRDSLFFITFSSHLQIRWTSRCEERIEVKTSLFSHIKTATCE